MNTSRVERLKRDIIKNSNVAFLITNLKNIRYLTGFTGSSGFLLLSDKRDAFFTDFRYKEQSDREVSGFDVVITKGDSIRFIKNYIKKLGIKRVVPEDTISYRTYKALSTTLQPAPMKEIVEKLRALKDKEELANIEEAVSRAERAFLETKPYIKAGNSERSIALRLEENMRQLGVYKPAFDTIVASGKNSALPHAGHTDKKLESGDFVIIDWGAEYNGYFSDMTRTFILHGEEVGKKKDIYETVRKANREAAAGVTQGVSMKQIDSFARDIIKKAGYGDYFGHATGHGVGMDVHEIPHVSERGSKTYAEVGMVFTIEPGIYIPDVGGVRIEDMVMVKEKKAKILTSLSRKLEIL